MSSILKALQNLDRDSGGKIEREPLSRRVDTRGLLGPRPGRSKFLSRLAVVAAAGLLLLGLAVVLLSRGLWTDGPHKQRPDTNPGAKTQAALPGSPVRSKTSASSPEPSAGMTATPPLPEAGHKSGTPATTPPAATPVEPSLGVRQLEKTDTETGPQTRNAPMPENRLLPARDKPDHEAAAAPSPAPPGRRMVTNPPPASEKRLTASVMTLQAITWSPDPEASFALVDGQIVRRGDVVAGYVIEAIFEDYVLVGKGGETWRVEFRHRSP